MLRFSKPLRSRRSEHGPSCVWAPFSIYRCLDVFFSILWRRMLILARQGRYGKPSGLWCPAFCRIKMTCYDETCTQASSLKVFLTRLRTDPAPPYMAAAAATRNRQYRGHASVSRSRIRCRIFAGTILLADARVG